MAIKKQTTLSSGVVAEYLRIASVSYRDKRAYFRVDIYKDHASRIAGNTPVEESLMACAMDMEDFNDSPLEQMYAYLKALPKLAGSEDI